MRIAINLSKDEANHIKSPHTFYDSCSEVESIMRKVQGEVDKL